MLLAISHANEQVSLDAISMKPQQCERMSVKSKDSSTD
jgi:hypothetical protein